MNQIDRLAFKIELSKKREEATKPKARVSLEDFEKDNWDLTAWAIQDPTYVEGLLKSPTLKGAWTPYGDIEEIELKQGTFGMAQPMPDSAWWKSHSKKPTQHLTPQVIAVDGVSVPAAFANVEQGSTYGVRGSTPGPGFQRVWNVVGDPEHVIGYGPSFTVPSAYNGMTLESRVRAFPPGWDYSAATINGTTSEEDLKWPDKPADLAELEERVAYRDHLSENVQAAMDALRTEKDPGRRSVLKKAMYAGLYGVPNPSTFFEDQYQLSQVSPTGRHVSDGFLDSITTQYSMPYSKTGAMPKNHGQPWSTEQREKLLAEWSHAPHEGSIPSIAATLGRTEKSIRAQLENMQLIKQEHRRY